MRRWREHGFALCPELSQGGILAVERHGSDALRSTYLEPMIAGRWTASMCSSEPQAGSGARGTHDARVPTAVTTCSRAARSSSPGAITR